MGKPVAESPALPTTFNFSISHHGAFVMLVAHTQRLVGCDVVESKARAYRLLGN
jgi:phosphopantetheinyl transferase